MLKWMIHHWNNLPPEVWKLAQKQDNYVTEWQWNNAYTDKIAKWNSGETHFAWISHDITHENFTWIHIPVKFTLKFKWKQHFTWSSCEHFHVNYVHVNFTFIAPFSKIYIWISHAVIVPVCIMTKTWLHWHFSNLNNCTEKHETVLLRSLIIYMYQY